MYSRIERKIAADIAKTLASMCVRNTELEDIHAGIGIITKTGDFSDVTIIDADGNEIPWNEASRINDDEMKILMKRIVNRIFTYFVQGEDARFAKNIDYYNRMAAKWDEPEIDTALDCTKIIDKQIK